MKLQITFLFALICSSAFGAFQYEVVDAGHFSFSRPYGTPWAITVTEGSGKLYVGDESPFFKSFTREVNAAAGDNFGVINIATGERMTSSATALTLDNGLTVYEVGDFSEGDTIGFWVRNRANDIGVSLGKSYDYDFFYRTGEDRTSGSMTFTDGWLWSTGTATMYFYGVENAPKGQPLPGVFASLAAGAVVLGLKRRKRAHA